QVDRNGATALSHVVVANMEDAEGKPLLYPNPVVDLLNVQWPETAEAVALIVRDALGRAVLVTTPDANTKGNWQVPVEHLSTGCYTLGLAMPNGDEQQAGVFLKR
ncbi:MAG: T9SS type A sorting domain-containing protein, partial [Flavobacteriales bacterium]